ncbi:hypothetical protein LA345_37375 (plasmid) [Burkholderia vietnamiensis]|uniref:Uncharacterized protein n=1 Tax=Burkholderia vietnamiensis (strain G4 / LMG 22486) TaxID=269482 RepID=A4JVJ7_BURVG|nr:hypothetical protein Bcep1808_7423 [Burkholderia vietnamiensis G4]MCB4349488.1 hypothetical protein [Burkholderia vietnamiensis]
MTGPAGAISLDVSDEVVNIAAALDRGLVVRLVAPPDREHKFGVLSRALTSQADTSASAWFVDAYGRKHENTLPMPIALGRVEFEALTSCPDDVAQLKALHSGETLRTTNAILEQAERRVIRSLVAAGGSEKLYRKALTLVQSAGGLGYPNARELGIDRCAVHLSEAGLIAERRVAVKDGHGVVRGAKILFEKPQHLSVLGDYLALKEASLGSTSSLNRLLKARGLDESMRVAIRALADSDLKALSARIDALYEEHTDAELDRIPKIALLYAKEFDDLIAESPFRDSPLPQRDSADEMTPG